MLTEGGILFAGQAFVMTAAVIWWSMRVCVGWGVGGGVEKD